METLEDKAAYVANRIEAVAQYGGNAEDIKDALLDFSAEILKLAGVVKHDIMD